MNQQQRNNLIHARDTLPLYLDWGWYVNDNNPNYRCTVGHLAINDACEPTQIEIAAWTVSASPQDTYGITFDELCELSHINEAAHNYNDRRRNVIDYINHLLNKNGYYEI